MSRFSYSDDEERPGQFELWQANCRRSLLGRKGQAVLRELEAALVAMPEKRLVKETLATKTGDVCAVGALLTARVESSGVPRPEAVERVRQLAVRRYAGHPEWDDEDGDQENTDEVAKAQGVPYLVAWKLVELNDIQIDCHDQTVEGPSPRPTDYAYSTGPFGSIRLPYTPEERYERVLEWVREHLRPVTP